MSKNRVIDVCIIGAGPAGLMAALSAARQGAEVLVVERNANAGKKLLLTGGGRCNLTHAGTIDDFLQACRPYNNLLKPALYQLSQEQLLEFFHNCGVQTYAEPDGCVFPENGTASLIRKVLLDEAASMGVTLVYGHRIKSISSDSTHFTIQSQHRSIHSSSVVVACGGASWPKTGSSGDGYQLAQMVGHTVIPPVGILCPVVCRETWPGSLQGTALPNITIKIKDAGKKHVISGSMVFTENGLGGPAAFDVSRLLADALHRGRTLSALLDFCPNYDDDKIEKWIIEQCASHPKKEMSAILSALLPRRLAETITSMVFELQKVTGAHVSRSARLRLVQLIKHIPLTFTECGNLEKATATRGGVNNKEVDFKTMQSRLCPGLYFAGEVLNIDGPCGGYNLQIAFSTGSLAGAKAAQWVLAHRE